MESASTQISDLFERHADMIYRLGLHVCGGEDDAQDLVQETFLQAFRKWDQFEGRSDPATWLYTIAARLCRRMHRLRAGEPRTIASFQALLPSGERMVPDIPDPRAQLFQETLKGEARELVERALSTLPAPFRIPLILKEIADFSIAEVAQILGIKQATVKTRVHRARLQLRKSVVEKLPKRDAPAPDHAASVCLDLLQSKQEALDKGVPFPLPSSELCSRCQSLFATLDLVHGACAEVGRGNLPEPLRDLLRSRVDDMVSTSAANANRLGD